MTDPNLPAASPEPAPAPDVPPTAAASGAPAAKSPLPLIALILAGLTLLLAVIPPTAAFAWPFAVAAIVLAIVALVKKSQPRVFAIIAIIVAPVAWIIAIVVTVVTVAMGIGNALDDAIGSDPSIEQPADAGQSDDADDDDEAPAAEVGTRANPAAIGSTITGSDWTVVINSVTLNATDEVVAASPLNDAPEGDNEYMLVNYTVTFTGDDADGGSPVWVGIEYVTPQGNTVDGLDDFVVAPDEMDRLSTLYTGASATGNIAIAIPVADGDQGVISVRPGILDDKVFVSVK